jgi:hypothetical protein
MTSAHPKKLTTHVIKPKKLTQVLIIMDDSGQIHSQDTCIVHCTRMSLWRKETLEDGTS